MAITFRAAGAVATGTTSVVVSQPTGTSTGDVLLAFILDHATSVGAVTPPSGWTLAGTGVAGTAGRIRVYWATVGLNGLTGTSWTWSSLTTRAEGVIVGYTGVDPTTPMDVTPSYRLNASGTKGTTSITPVDSGCMVVAGFAALASGSTWTTYSTSSPGALTNQFYGVNSTYCSIEVAGAVQATAGATGVSTVTMGTAGANVGVLIALHPMATFAHTGSGVLLQIGFASTVEVDNYTYPGGGSIAAAGTATTSNTSTGGSGSWSLVAHTGIASAGTTNAIDTTGANLLVALITSGQAGTAFVDTYNNVWLDVGGNNSTPDGYSALYFCHNPTVGPGHTISLGIGYGSVCLAAFSGSAASPRDQQISGNSSDLNVTTFQTGSVTPTTDGQLVISGLGIGKTGTAASIDSGFTVIDQAMAASGVTYGSALAYLVQSSATTANPTWTRDVAGDVWGVNATFKVAAGSGGVTTFSYVGSGNLLELGSATTSESDNYSYTGLGSVVIGGSGAAAATGSAAYVGIGTLLEIGSATTSEVDYYSFTGTGILTASGTATTGITCAYAYTGAGTLLEIGSATVVESTYYTGAGSGSVTLAGSATTAHTGAASFAFMGAGAVAAVGAAATSATGSVSYASSGTITAAGAATTVYSRQFATAGSGAVTISGTAGKVATGNALYAGSGGVSIAGAAVASATGVANLIYVGSGSVVVTGSAASTRTAQYTYSGTGSAAISGTVTDAYSRQYGYTGSGAVTVAGTGSAAFTGNAAFTGSGSITMAGAVIAAAQAASNNWSSLMMMGLG